MFNLWLRGLGLWFCLALPAAADGISDCSGPSFRAAAAIAAPDFDCEVISSEVLNTPSGEAILRAVRSRNGDPSHDLGQGAALSALAEAYEAWAGTAADLGLVMPHVTLLVADPTVEGDPFIDGGTVAPGVDVLPGYMPGECLLRVDTGAAPGLATAAADDWLRVKLFHCVQGNTWPGAMLDPGGIHRWWVTGQAVFMASLASPSPNLWNEAEEDFLPRIGSEPLTSLGPGAAIFFAHLWQTRGLASHAALILALEDTETLEAQGQAISDGVGEEALMGFATAAVDGRIVAPGNAIIDALPPGDPVVFEERGETRFADIPHTIESRRIGFMNGTYALLTGLTFLTRPEAGKDWGEMPFEVKPRICGDVETLVFARYVTSGFSPDGGYPLTAELMESCTPCLSYAEVDQCLVGTWKLDTQALSSWLQTQSQNTDAIFGSVTGSASLQVKANGEMLWVADGIDATATIRPPQGMTAVPTVRIVATGTDKGQWSTSGGLLRYCEREPYIDFDITVTIDGQRTELSQIGLVSDIDATYSCSGSTLTMTYIGPLDVGTAAPEWRFTKAN